MLKKIHKIYFIVGFLLYSILTLQLSSNTLMGVFSLNLFNFITYYFVLYISLNMISKNYNKKYLVLLVLLYTLVLIFLYNSISYNYTNNYFVFSAADALFYHDSTIAIIDKPFGQAIDAYFSSHSNIGFDDLGMIIVLYPLYQIAETNLILNAFYLLVSLLTALSMFSLSKNFMSRKYAYMATLTYSLSSFVIFFHSSGLKESFMVFLIIVAFDYYYRFLRKKNPLYLIVFVFSIAFLLLFRPAIPVFIVGAIGLGSLLTKKSGLGVKAIGLFLLIVLFANINLLIEVVNRYMSGGFEMLIYARESEGMIKGSIDFTYAVNILAQLIGPLPTLVSSEKVMLTLFAPGLIYRVLLAIPFWIGVRYIFKTKSYLLYPIVLFILMEMSALALLMEGLELRKSMPHIAMVYIVAFWFMDKYDNKLIVFRKKKRFKYFVNFSIFILGILILYWNFK